MERYLGGEEIPAVDIAAALKNAVTQDEIYPVACGVATKNLGSHALLDLLVEGVPSPAKKGSPIETDASIAAFVFKTVADPFAGRISVFRVYAGEVKGDTTLVNHRDHSKERLGSLMILQGKDHEKSEGFGSGRPRRGRQAEGRADRRRARRRGARPRAAGARFPRAGDELRCHGEDEGRRGQGRPGDPSPRGGRPDAAAPARPADGRGPAFGDEPDPRRGRSRACEAAFRRRDGAAPAARPVRRDDQGLGSRAGPVQEADRRPRPVRGLPRPAGADRRARRLRVPRQDRRRCGPAGLPAGGRQGDPGGDAARRARGRAGARRARVARRRLVPLRSTRRRWRSRSPARWRFDRPTRRRSRPCSSRSWRSR